MIRSYKIRLLPTAEQEQLMWQHIGCCRVVWNYMLDLQQKRYENGDKHLSRFDMIKLLTPLKKESEHGWLCNVSNTSLQITCTDLAKAYDRFFKKIAKHPRFKSRKGSKSNFPTRCNKMYFLEDTVKIEKLGKVRYQTNYKLPLGKGHKFSNPRISFVNNKWLLSFGVECENQAPELTDTLMGIDLGIKETATVAFGDEQLVFHNINKSKRVRNMERRLKHLQRNVSRKYNSHKNYVKTNNIIKAEAKVRKAYTHLSNIRKDYTHKTTHELVSKFPCRVTMEDLNVSGMMKNRHLAKAVQQQTFYEFIRQMKYKCEWLGIEFVQADRFYPSSKMCSECGAIKRDLRLKDRTFVCPSCGAVIDRDYNAAINLMKYEALPVKASA